MILVIIQLLAGFFLLIKGSDWFVNGAASLAKRSGVPEIIIGLTIVSFGTSAPELLVNINSSVKNYNELVTGNIIGSNLFNLLCILGVAGIIRPIVVKVNTVWMEIPFSLLAAAVLFTIANDQKIFGGHENKISRWDGIILLLLFLLFMVYIFYQVRKEKDLPIEVNEKMTGVKISIYLILGLAGLVLGGRWVVESAVTLAREFNMSGKMIGLTIVSAGTSLPELATSAVAVWKGRNDIAIGNVIGSNVFNIFLILGLSALINPVKYNIQMNTDLWLLIISTLLLFIAMFTGIRKKLDRWEALLMLIIFAGYMTFVIIRN